MSNIRKRGFASMDPTRLKEIASQGGKAAHSSGAAYEWTPETARAAGKKGGKQSAIVRSGRKV
jgi:uncharacterized protein